MIKKLTLGLLTAAFLLAAAPDSEAHTKCKIKGPFGGWTWGPCPPHSHPRGRTTPVRKAGTVFKIYNIDSTDTISYYYEGKRYSLKPGFHRTHTSNKKYAVIDFDYIVPTGGWESKKVFLNVGQEYLRVWRNGKYFRYVKKIR